MFGIAAATSTRRPAVLALVLGAGVVPLRPIAVMPIAGIVLGGAMTAICRPEVNAA